MNLSLAVRAVLTPFARRLQRAYARVVHASGPRVPHEGTRGPLGGRLAQALLQPGLVRFERWGFVFRPSVLGLPFGLWWKGSRHQRARGRAVPIDAGRLARELEEELARAVEAADRGTS